MSFLKRPLEAWSMRTRPCGSRCSIALRSASRLCETPLVSGVVAVMLLQAVTSVRHCGSRGIVRCVEEHRGHWCGFRGWAGAWRQHQGRHHSHRSGGNDAVLQQVLLRGPASHVLPELRRRRPHHHVLRWSEPQVRQSVRDDRQGEVCGCLSSCECSDADRCGVVW